MRQAQLKYGTLEDKIKAVSGRDGAMQIDSPKQIQAAIDRLK